MPVSDVTDARERLLSGTSLSARRLEVGGVSTFLLEGGNGAPIVMLHGPSEHAAKWFRVFPELITSYHVIAPDLPGHGETTVRGDVLDAERILAWLEALIAETCPTPPILVGHTIGGAIAARFAARQPERVSRLVLVDTLGLVPFHPTPAFGQALMAFTAQPGDDTFERMWDECAFDAKDMRRRLGEDWQVLKASILERAHDAKLHAQQQVLADAFIFPAIATDDLARIAAPTTLIWGRHDAATRLQVAETASARYGWPLIVIENAGADPETEQPSEYIAALRTAVREELSPMRAI